MKKIRLEKDRQVRWLIIGVGYALLVVFLGAYINFTNPFNSEPTITPSFSEIMLWTVCYMPLFVFPFMAKWETTEFGFSINPLSAAVSLFFAMFCGLTVAEKPTPWVGAMVEAFARTGEEVFFRGFLFVLILKIIRTVRGSNIEDRLSWMWAGMISSFVFALVHTQTFQPSYFADPVSSSPVTFSIIQRLLNIFLMGFSLFLLRYWTKSILPGSIIHSMLNGGPFTLPFVLLIHGAILLWARIR